MSENVINLLKPINPSWYLFALEILKSSATLPLQRKVVIFFNNKLHQAKKERKGEKYLTKFRRYEREG